MYERKAEGPIVIHGGLTVRFSFFTRAQQSTSTKVGKCTCSALDQGVTEEDAKVRAIPSGVTSRFLKRYNIKNFFDFRKYNIFSWQSHILVLEGQDLQFFTGKSYLF